MIALPAQSKICKACGKRKPVAAYHRRKSNRDGRAGRCKPCLKAAARARAARAPVVLPDSMAIIAAAREIKAQNLRDMLDRRRRAPIGSPLAAACRGYYREWRKARRRQSA